MMKKKQESLDPLGILRTTEFVVNNAEHVQLHPENISRLVPKISGRLRTQRISALNDHLGTTGNVPDDVQLILVLDSVNFCFWNEKSDRRWAIEFRDEVIPGGWRAVIAAFERAREEGLPVLNPIWLRDELDDNTMAHIFRSTNKLSIPMIQERRENLNQLGAKLAERYNGSALNILSASGYQASVFIHTLSEHFPSFRDISLYQDRAIPFYKRAQACIARLGRLEGLRTISGIEHLAAFADYRLPQILEYHEIISYTPELRSRIDAYEIIPHDSPEEIEIRAATVQAVELIKKHLPSHTAQEIDLALWLTTQEPEEKRRIARPHHRSYTIFY